MRGKGRWLIGSQGAGEDLTDLTVAFGDRQRSREPGDGRCGESGCPLISLSYVVDARLLFTLQSFKEAQYCISMVMFFPIYMELSFLLAMCPVDMLCGYGQILYFVAIKMRLASRKTNNNEYRTSFCVWPVTFVMALWILYLSFWLKG